MVSFTVDDYISFNSRMKMVYKGLLSIIDRPIHYKDGWFIIPNYSRYLINVHGVVYNASKNEIVREHIRNTGYKAVNVIKDGESRYRTTGVHRLLALAFKKIDDNIIKPEVDHLDMDKNNNDIGNLEWVSHLENIRRMNRSFRPQLYRKPLFRVRKYDNEEWVIISGYDDLASVINKSRKVVVDIFGKKRNRHKEYRIGDYIVIAEGRRDSLGNQIFTTAMGVLVHDMIADTFTVYHGSRLASENTGVNIGTINDHCKNSEDLWFRPIMGYRFYHEQLYPGNISRLKDGELGFHIIARINTLSNLSTTGFVLYDKLYNVIYPFLSIRSVSYDIKGMHRRITATIKRTLNGSNKNYRYDISPLYLSKSGMKKHHGYLCILKNNPITNLKDNVEIISLLNNLDVTLPSDR